MSKNTDMLHHPILLRPFLLVRYQERKNIKQMFSHLLIDSVLRCIGFAQRRRTKRAFDRAGITVFRDIAFLAAGPAS